MIGPAVQGMLFMGVIYWYTKGMLSLINDYYRDEFKTYIDKDDKISSSPSKKSQLSLDTKESCPIQQVEGLPDLLKSTNEHTKADGIVIRDIEKMSPDKYPNCNLQPALTEKTRQKYIPDEMPPISATELNSHRHEANINREKFYQDFKSISKPSEIGQLNYRKMTNQQTSNTDANGDDEGKCSTRTSLNRNSGNCLENVDRVADVQERKAEVVYKRDNTHPCTVAGAAEMRPVKPKIAVNGVLMPTEELRKRLDEKRQKDTCRRKSVNEMVQYWTQFLAAMDEKEQASNQLRQALPTVGQSASGAMARSKSSGDIIARNHATTLSEDNS